MVRKHILLLEETCASCLKNTRQAAYSAPPSPPPHGNLQMLINNCIMFCHFILVNPPGYGIQHELLYIDYALCRECVEVVY